jgi:predicted ferric reductase
VTGDLVTTDVAFLTRRENFLEKFSAALGFLSGIIAFLSILIVTMTWFHFLVPLGLNVDVSSFLLMLSFMILAAASIVAPMVLKNGLPKISGI